MSPIAAILISMRPKLVLNQIRKSMSHYNDS